MLDNPDMIEIFSAGYTCGLITMGLMMIFLGGGRKRK